MSERHVSLAEARKQLGELLARANYAGERIVVTKHGKPMAAMVSLADLVHLHEVAPPATAEPAVEPSVETITIAATLARVWWSFDNGSKLLDWWPGVEIDREPGREFRQLWEDADGRWDYLVGAIAEYLPGECIQIDWRDGTHTTIGFTSDDETTEVTVTHSAGRARPGWLLDLDALHQYLS